VDRSEWWSCSASVVGDVGGSLICVLCVVCCVLCVVCCVCVRVCVVLWTACIGLLGDIAQTLGTSAAVLFRRDSMKVIIETGKLARSQEVSRLSKWAEKVGRRWWLQWW
jgi:hypothetical protein